MSSEATKDQSTTQAAEPQTTPAGLPIPPDMSKKMEENAEAMGGNIQPHLSAADAAEATFGHANIPASQQAAQPETQHAEPRRPGRPSAGPREPRKPAAEIKRELLTSDPKDPCFGTPTERMAVVSKEGDQFIATYNDVVIGRVKRAHDLHGLLIEHRYTIAAQQANIAKLHFVCEVEALPSASMAAKVNENDEKIIGVIDALDLSNVKGLRVDKLAAALVQIRNIVQPPAEEPAEEAPM